MLLNHCSEFLREIEEVLNGTRKPEQFFQLLNEEYHRLAREFAGTMPNFEIAPREDDQKDSDGRFVSLHSSRKILKNESTQGKIAFEIHIIC